MRINDVLFEFAPAGGGGSGDYFQALASAWYNGVFDTGSLPKGIKTQQDVERLLNRGIVCPDGKTRKLHIDYNSDFDGVEIYSDDYYEHSDYDEQGQEVDSRTGQKWGPYDYMEFSDEQLDESAQWRDPKYKDQLYTQEPPDYNDTREYDNAMWDPKPDDYPGRKELPGGGEYDRTDPLVRGAGIGRSGIKHNILDRGKRKGLPSRDQITSLKQSIRDVHGRHTRANLPEQGMAEGKEDKIAQLKKDYATAVHWSKNDTNPHKREAARQKAEKIKRHLETQYKQGVAEGSLNEFAANDGDGGEDDALRNYARMWWAGDDATQQQIEQALAKMGWEIGEDEGSYDNGGVFVVRAGDENGNSYQSWAAEDLTEGVTEGVNDYLWHGSKSEHDILYPQQANDTGGKEKSNKNAVYATPSAKVAIAMGLTTPGSDTGMFPNDPQMVLFKGDIRKGQMVYLHKVPKDLFIKHNDREWYSKPGVKAVKPIEVVTVPVDKYLDLIRTATPKDLELQKKNTKEGDLNEKSTSQAQFRTMAAAAHNPEFARKVGIKPSVAREFHKADKTSSYKSLPKKADESKQVPAEKEADYGDDYQDMVKRVKKLAGLGPLKTVYDPNKRVYKNMPTAVQPKK
jgi:hypothetical protein